MTYNNSACPGLVDEDDETGREFEGDADDVADGRGEGTA
jgi:hypothetical protein